MQQGVLGSTTESSAYHNLKNSPLPYGVIALPLPLDCVPSCRGSIAVWGSNFTENRASRGGAIYVSQTNLTVSSSVFFHNSAHSMGGAMYVGDQAYVALMTTHLNNNNAGQAGWLSRTSSWCLEAPCLLMLSFLDQGDHWQGIDNLGVPLLEK